MSLTVKSIDRLAGPAGTVDYFVRVEGDKADVPSEQAFITYRFPGGSIRYPQTYDVSSMFADFYDPWDAREIAIDAYVASII